MNETRDNPIGVGQAEPWRSKLQSFQQRLIEAEATIQVLLRSLTSERDTRDALQMQVAEQKLELKQAIEELDVTFEELHSTVEELETQNQELRAAHQATDAERKLYRDLFEFASDGYLVTDSNGIIREANRVTADLIGVPQGSLLGRPMSSLLAHGEQSTFRSYLQRLRAGEQIREWECFMVANEDKRIPILIDALLVPETKPRAANQSSTLRWTLHDLGERRQAEMERAELVAQLERRTMQLQVASDVGRTASLHLAPDEFLRQAATIIHEAFEAYSVGIFILDRAGDHAVLRAAVGEPGQHFVEAGRKIEVQASSLAGWTIAHAEARLGQAGDDTEFPRTPGFPYPRSRVSLPLMSQDKCIGALLVQSMHENHFTVADIPALQTMADQLGIAIENARLYQEARESAPAGRGAD